MYNSSDGIIGSKSSEKKINCDVNLIPDENVCWKIVIDWSMGVIPYRQVKTDSTKILNFTPEQSILIVFLAYVLQRHAILAVKFQN